MLKLGFVSYTHVFRRCKHAGKPTHLLSGCQTAMYASASYKFVQTTHNQVAHLSGS